jgi:hypothetical protein
MLLTKDVTIEKSESELNSELESNRFGYSGKLNINQAGLRTDFEREEVPAVCTQIASLYITSSEWETQEGITLSAYEVNNYQWSPNKVGYVLGATYPIGAEATVADTRAAIFVSAVGETFLIGCSVVGALKNEIELPESIEGRLDKIRGLKDNWDSYSASRISGKAIEKAKSLLFEARIHCGISLLEEAFIAPCSDGGIQLEWTSESEIELIVKISASAKKATVLLTKPSGKEKEGTIKGLEDWNGLLDDLCDRRA